MKKGFSWKKLWRELMLPIPLIALFFVLRLYSYRIAQLLNRSIISEDLLLWDKNLLNIDGDILPVFLQRKFSLPFISSWVYVVVFLFVFVVGILAFRKSSFTFRLYVYGLLSLIFITIVFNILFPSLSPWYLDGVERVFGSKLFGNDYVSFPSFYVMCSFYTASWGEHILGPWGLFLFLIPILVIFSVLYGGESYLVSCIAGCALASLGFLITAGPDWENRSIL